MTELFNQIRNYNNRMNKAYHFITKDLHNPSEHTIFKFMKIIKNGGFNIPEEKFKTIIKKINFNIDNTCSLGGLAHLLIYFDLPYYKMAKDKINPDVIKEIIITHFLNNGLNPNLKDNYGYTFIESAIIGKPTSRNDFEANNPQFIYNLIAIAKEYGLDVNTKDNMGNTIIHTAISSQYYNESIVELLKALGDNFDVKACNKTGQGIIDYLDFCINTVEPLTENNNSIEFEKDKNIWKNRLKSQRDEIINYIQTRSNPLALNPDTRKMFLEQISDLERYSNLNLRMETFLGYPNGRVKFDKVTITFETLELLKEMELNYSSTLLSNVLSITSQFFGVFSNEIVEFITLGKEPTIISFINLGLKVNNPYPKNKILIEKIEWLHDTLAILTQQNDKVIGPNIPRTYKPNQQN